APPRWRSRCCCATTRWRPRTTWPPWPWSASGSGCGWSGARAPESPDGRHEKGGPGARLFRSPVAGRSGGVAALAFGHGLHGQADAALLVHFQHLDLDHVAFLEHVADALHALVRDLRDVHQAVLARGDGHERAEVHQLGDLALVDAARLDVRGDLLDARLRSLAGGGVDRGGGDGAVVLDVDLGAGLLGDPLDHRA